MSLFVFGTFWFWALIGIEFVALLIFLEREKYFAAPFSILATLGLLVIFGNRNIIDFVIQNPIKCLIYFFCYFLVGTVYAVSPYIGKWWLFVYNVREKNREEKQKFISNIKNKIASIEQDLRRHPNDVELIDYKTVLENSNGVMTAELLPYWKEVENSTYFEDFFGRKVKITKPLPEQFKSRIISWIAYWPPSMFWTLLNDPIRKIGKMIYNLVSNSLRNMSDTAWQKEDEIAN